jgi:hypothetical protein
MHYKRKKNQEQNKTMYCYFITMADESVTCSQVLEVMMEGEIFCDKTHKNGLYYE